MIETRTVEVPVITYVPLPAELTEPLPAVAVPERGSCDDLAQLAQSSLARNAACDIRLRSIRAEQNTDEGG